MVSPPLDPRFPSRTLVKASQLAFYPYCILASSLAKGSLPHPLLTCRPPHTLPTTPSPTAISSCATIPSLLDCKLERAEPSIPSCFALYWY
ncbi:unnamed protein product [Staurois parvus]|uniref:Uncharacterized protein n=1 Tax=Staurois parvus TaxID=386267 RepID=A0ABN9ES82_9NEOB|nr:unnamed protein product [Staurois parvus]